MRRSHVEYLIIDKTEGNPFFMEETVQVLFDEGALVRIGAAAKLTKPLNSADGARDSLRSIGPEPLARKP